MPLPPPTPAPSLLQATAKTSISMVENWIWQSHLELKALMEWHNERYAEVKAPCENGALKAEIVLKSYKIIDALEKKLGGTLWSGIEKQILLDIIYRTPSWKVPAGYMLSISDRRGLVLRELRARLREREQTKQIVSQGKEDGAKNLEEIERERERQRRTVLEQWRQLNDLRLMGSVGEYDEARRKFVDDMAEPGPRLSEGFELVELGGGSRLGSCEGRSGARLREPILWLPGYGIHSSNLLATVLRGIQ